MTIRTALVNSLIYPLSAARKPTLSSCDYEKVTSRSLVLAFVACCYSMSAQHKITRPREPNGDSRIYRAYGISPPTGQ